MILGAFRPFRQNYPLLIHEVTLMTFNIAFILLLPHTMVPLQLWLLNNYRQCKK